MGACRHLLGAAALALIIRGAVVVTGNPGQDLSIQVKHEKGGLFLHCSGSGSQLRWSKDGQEIGGANESKLLVGLAADDPRGLYQCHLEGKHASLQLYFRMCQYCVQLNLATVLGMVAAEIVATAFLAGAVWCLAAQEPGRLSRASDKQTLLAHDQLYQPLGERNNGQYSHIGVAKARHR